MWFSAYCLDRTMFGCYLNSKGALRFTFAAWNNSG